MTAWPFWKPEAKLEEGLLIFARNAEYIFILYEAQVAISGPTWGSYPTYRHSEWCINWKRKAHLGPARGMEKINSGPLGISVQPTCRVDEVGIASAWKPNRFINTMVGSSDFAYCCKTTRPFLLPCYCANCNVDPATKWLVGRSCW